MLNKSLKIKQNIFPKDIIGSIIKIYIPDINSIYPKWWKNIVIKKQSIKYIVILEFCLSIILVFFPFIVN